MSTSQVQVGVVTKADVGKSFGLVWLLSEGWECGFTIPKEQIQDVQVGSWIEVAKQNEEIEFLKIIKPVLLTTLDSRTGMVCVSTRLVFPPEERQMTDYKNMVHSVDFGKVGNFARKQLLKMNDNIIRPGVTYVGYISRIPFGMINNLLTKQYNTVWSVPAQRLELLSDTTLQNGVPMQSNHCDSASTEIHQNPFFNELYAFNGEEGGADCDSAGCAKANADIRSQSKTSAEEYDEDFFDEGFGSDDIDKSSDKSSTNGSDNAVSNMLNTDQKFADLRPAVSCGLTHCVNGSINIGIVTRCHPDYCLIWGKNHGYVILSTGGIAEYVNLQLAQWVIYECMETDVTVSSIKYEVLSYKPIDVEDECFVDEDNKQIWCRTTISEVQSDVLGKHSFGQMIAFESDLIGRLRLHHSVCTALRRLGTKIKCAVRLLNDRTDNYPWELMKVECGQRYVSVDELLQIFPSPDKTELSTEDKSKEGILSVRAPESSSTRQNSNNLPFILRNSTRLVESSPVATNPNSEKLHTAASKEKLELDRYIPDPISKVVNVPIAVFVSQTDNYGIVWNLHRGAILVPQKHIGSLNPGVWVKTSVRHILNPNDENYEFIAVSYLQETKQYLPIRSRSGIVQVKVIMEPGGVEEKLFGVFCMVRRSEVGKVYLPVSMLNCFPEQPESKKLTGWVSLVDNKYWIACALEFEQADAEEYKSSSELVGAQSVCRSDADLDFVKDPRFDSPIRFPQLRSDTLEKVQNRRTFDDKTLDMINNWLLKEGKGDNVVRMKRTRFAVNNVSDHQKNRKSTAANDELTLLSSLRTLFNNQSVRTAILKVGYWRELTFVLKSLELK